MQIRSARTTDLDRIVSLHSRYLPGFFESMGKEFLVDLYSCILRLEPGGFSVVVSEETLVGFVVVTFDNNSFSKKLLALMLPHFVFGVLTRAYNFSNSLFLTCRKTLQTMQLVLQRSGSTPIDDVAVLWEIVVHPDFRRRRIGSRLLDHVESYLDGKGKKEFFVPVYEGNENAIRFYSRIGFRRVMVLKGALGRVQLMKKEIWVD